MAKKFVIVDGSSLLYRAFYALPLLSTADGQFTNAVYGFATMLVKLVAELKPDTLAVALDKGKKTFRNEMFEAYKGTRKPTPMELVVQFPLLHELLDAFGIKTVEVAGYEADDIIGTLATKAAQEGREVVIVTGDRDALQLVGGNIQVVLTKKGISELDTFDRDAFFAKYGLEPEKLIDLKGLMGDTSDNIPGVPGVGEKTATKLLLEFGSMEEVLENIDQVGGKKLQERLRENRELALLSKRLATIVRDMELIYNEAEFEMHPNLPKLKEFCRRYEFRSVLKRIDEVFAQDDGLGFGTVVEFLAPSAKVLSDNDELAAWVRKARAAGRLVFAPVYEGKVPFLRLRALALADETGELVYVESSLYAWQDLVDLLGDETVTKITHDFKPLYHIGIAIRGPIFDTMLAAYLLDPSDNAYSVDALIGKYLERFERPQEFHDTIESAAWTADCVRALHVPLQSQLEAENLARLYEEIELPLLEVLASMERNGIVADRAGLKAMAKDMGERIEIMMREIYDLAGMEFNINSTKQLGEILFERMGIPAVKKTKRGYSTDAEVLEGLAGEYPIAQKILDYRVVTKLKSTYLDGLEVLIDDATGRIHTSFNQMVTATGRLSSSEPNLQNIPVRTEAGRKIRELFVPGEGYDYLLSADYSQIELRVLAHMSKDRNFVEAFTHGQDIHTRTASEVFGVPMDLVSGEMRGRAKAVNFGIVYGISDYGLATGLKVSRAEAAKYIENYFKTCGGIKSYIDNVIADARKTGIVMTLFGRKRRLSEINSSNYNQRSFAERIAMNTPIQGTAADIIKKAMVEVYRKIEKAGLKSRILLQVHDELVLEVPEAEVAEVSELLRETMQDTVKFDVPLVVDVHVGKNWAETK